MSRFKISLETLSNIKDFVDAVNGLSGNVTLENERGTYRVSAKSFLGVAAAVDDWNDIWVVSDNDSVYMAVRQFII